MTVRIGKINVAECPRLEDAKSCWSQTNQFKVTVRCNEWRDNPQAQYVHLYNCGDEEIQIYRQFQDNCDPLLAPLRCQGSVLTLTDEYPDIMLTVPGTYIFVTSSGEPFEEDDFAVEKSAVDYRFAELWLKQQALCCCAKGTFNE